VIANFKNALNGAKVEEAFLTAVAPASSAYDGINEFYESEKDYIYALADALREEYQAIYKSGLLLQVDDAVLANMYDTLVQKDPANYKRWAELRIEALNHALDGIPEDRVRYHICFGSWHVPHTADANLSDLIDLILKVITHGSTGLLNLASGSSATFRSVAEAVAARAGRTIEIATSARQNPATHRHFDVTNLLRAFPGVHFTPLEDGLAATFADMRVAAGA